MQYIEHFSSILLTSFVKCFSTLAIKGLFELSVGMALWVVAKPNSPSCWHGVPLASRHKFDFKNLGQKKDKKQSVGNECWLNSCPFVVSFLCCWPSAILVCPC